MKTGDHIHYAGYGKVILQRWKLEYFSHEGDVSLWAMHDVSQKEMLLPIIKKFKEMNPAFRLKKVRGTYQGLAI